MPENYLKETNTSDSCESVKLFAFIGEFEKLLDIFCYVEALKPNILFVKKNWKYGHYWKYACVN